MMKNNYDKSLASGIVCSSGTLGQIIPPSIVLIILSDQLATASDAADNMRRLDYKIATGSMNIPGQFSVESVSAGNMFLGAFFQDWFWFHYICFMFSLLVFLKKCSSTCKI